MNYNSNNCKIYAPFEECTGHGSCSKDGLCECDEGWSPIGDYSTKVGDHCGLHISTIRALWIIAIIPFPILVLLSLKVTKTRAELIQASHQNKEKYKNKSISWLEPVALFPISFFLCSLFTIPLCLLKILDPTKYAIAYDVVSTTMSFFFAIFGIGGMCIYLLLLIDFMAGYAKMMPYKARETIQIQGKIVTNLTKLTVCLTPIFGFIPYINLIYPDYDSQCMIAFSIAMLFVDFTVGFSLIRYLNIISREIRKHLESNTSNSGSNHSNQERFLVVKNKIDRSGMIFSFVLLFSVTVFSIVIFWPLITRNAGYFSPMLMTATGWIGIVFEISIMNDSDKDNSLNSRSIDDNSNGRVVMPIAVVYHARTDESKPASARVMATNDKDDNDGHQNP